MFHVCLYYTVMSVPCSLLITYWERADLLGLLCVMFLLLYPRYEVYRGYIVFAFSVNMVVCLFVCLSVYKLFSVKDFSATRLSILKFGTKLDSDELYCVTKKTATYCLSVPLFVHFSMFKISVTDFSAPIGASVFKLCIHLQIVKYIM